MNSADWQNPEHVVLWENTPKYRELMLSYAGVGLDDHNKRNGTNFVLLDFLRATDFPGASGRMTDLQIHVYDPRSEIETYIDAMVWTGNMIEIGVKLNDRPNHPLNASSSSLIGGKDEDLNVPCHASYELALKQGDPNIKPEHVAVEATYLHRPEAEGARAGYVRYYTHHLRVNVDGHIWYATALQRSWLLPVHEDSANSFRLPPVYPPLEPKDADGLQPMHNSQLSRYFEIAAAWFAVALYNFKTRSTLAFHGISSGKSKTCCMGDYYYLTLDVTNHGRPGTLTTSLRFDGPVFEATSLYRPHD